MEQSHYTDANSWSDNREVPHILLNPQFRCRAIILCSEPLERYRKKVKKYKQNKLSTYLEAGRVVMGELHI
jgi:hypothetical protein